MIWGAIRSVSRKSLILLTMGIACASAVWAGEWTVLGPEGGDVRSLSYDPRNPDHIYLGTGTGTMFLSEDGGHNWSRFAHLGDGDEFVLDHIALDPQNPKHIYVAAWSVVNQQAGDIFHSRDGGKDWEALPGMHGKSVRAMAISASNSKVLVAGALDGVFRSNDGGSSWQRISPANHADIKNIESVAIDPKNPDVVYAGTWHLAWKTDDGGANWHRINKGMIDDSDVFSIIVDSTNPSVVFASACSGIYKSDNAGDLFRKLQGIPFSARRTRVPGLGPVARAVDVVEDPFDLGPGEVGGQWQTGLVVVPLLATDRAGVMASDDGAQTFTASNHGYTHRYVSSILADRNDTSAIIVGVVNDRELGGVFVTRDAGRHWLQKSSGLGGRDVFALKQAPNGALVAGTNRGIFMLDRTASLWRPINAIVSEKAPARTGKRGAKKSVVIARATLDARVNDIEITPKRWIIATSAGLFTSSDQGKSWSGGAVMGKNDFVAVELKGERIVAATRNSLLYSANGGTTWQEAALSALMEFNPKTLDEKIHAALNAIETRSAELNGVPTALMNALHCRTHSIR